jgi:hypothetical protein
MTDIRTRVATITDLDAVAPLFDAGRQFHEKPPTHLWLLAALYGVASLAHFTHNAEFIAFYPNMPKGLTREHVYLAWLAITSLGVGGLLLVGLGLRASGWVLVAAYGALGLDGLAHYTLALCSEHSVTANVTIGAEAASGVALMLTALLQARKDWRCR